MTHPCDTCRLRNSGAFRPASAEEIDFIAQRRSTLVTADSGARIVEEGSSGNPLQTIYSGWAFRFKSLPNGRRQILNFLLPGDLVGLQEEFTDQSSYGVEALTPIELCVFKDDTVWETMTRHPRLGYGLTWITARDEIHLDANLLTTGQRTAVERIAMLLIHLYRRSAVLGLNENGVAPFPLNQSHIADALGLSLVHTNKSLRRLRAIGMFTISNQTLRLDNVSALERIAEYYDRPQRKLPLL